MQAERFQGANLIEAGQLSPYWGEHAARYLFALPFVPNKEILDIACGTGYGVGILAESAKYVVGVDADWEAAKAARKECNANAEIVLGDALNLPFYNDRFDTITCFETLEHLDRRSEFLKEINRVLRPDGRLVLSTPNANYTRPPNGIPANPFHVFEYEPRELLTELQEHFRVEKVLGQTLVELFHIPPFSEAQERLPKDFSTQTRLFGWKLLNKLPTNIREYCSRAIWGRPFYPTQADYRFSTETIDDAPVMVAICSKK